MDQLDQLIKSVESGEVEANEELLGLIAKLEKNKEERKKELKENKKHKELLKAISEIKIEAPIIPEINIPEINVPDIKLPDITIPEIKAPDVIIPKIAIPEIVIPEIKSPDVKVILPDEIKIKKPSWLQIPSILPLVVLLKAIKTAILGFKLPTDAKNPVSVRLSDGKEFYKGIQEAYRGLTAFKQPAAFKNVSGSEESGLIDDDRHLQIDVVTATSIETKLQTVIDNQNEFITNDIDVFSSTITYIGSENKDGDWYVKRIDTTSQTAFRHASIQNNPSYPDYDTAWDARGSLSYQIYSGAF